MKLKLRKIKSKDSDMRGSLPAMKRAAKRAWELSVATNTPFVVWKDGKVVDLNSRPAPARRKRTKRATSKR